MVRFFNKMFIVLLASLVNASSHTNTKCVSLNNHKCDIQPTLINLNPNGYSQELHFCPFAINLDRCVGSSNNDISNMCCKRNRRFKSKSFQNNYRNKWFENSNKAHIMQM